MKKLLSISILTMSLGMVSHLAMAESHCETYETEKHYVRVNCSYATDLCTYQSWNKPRKMGHGQSDLQIAGGRERTVEVNGYFCSRFEFQKGNTAINLDDCLVDGRPKGSSGELEVLINGQRKAHYWTYNRKIMKLD